MVENFRKLSSFSQQIAGYTAQVLSAICVVLMCLWADNENETDYYLGGLQKEPEASEMWHIILMTVSMGFCLVQAILAYRLLPFGHTVDKYLHGIINLAGLICAFIGIAKIVHNRNEEHSPPRHFISLHSWLGLITLVLYVQNYVFGFIHFALPLLSPKMKKLYLPNHKFLGLMTLGAAVVTMIAGMVHVDETWKDGNPATEYSKFPPGKKIGNGLGVILLIMVILVAFAIQDFPTDDLKVTTRESSVVHVSPKSEA
eukprot:gene13307-28193_t